MVKCPFKFIFDEINAEDSKGFFGLPAVDDISGYDMIFTGIPYECDNTAKPGASMGVNYFRRDHFGLGLCDQGLDIDMMKSIKGADCGDIIIDDSSKEAALQCIKNAEDCILSAGAVSFAIGGDDMTNYALIKSAYEKFGKIAVLHFGGSVSAALMKAASEGMCELSRCAEIGIRNGMAKYGADIARYGIKVINSADFDHKTLDEIGAEIKTIAGSATVMIIFDMNFFDPAFVTSAAKPYPGGMAAHEMVFVCEGGLVGLDIKAVSVCGMLNYNDPGETSLNNMAEAVCKLYAIAAYNIASSKEAG